MKPPFPREIEPPRMVFRVVRGVGALAATYTYFLVFAQFGLLRAMDAALGGGHPHLGSTMATLGVAGIAGSAIMARPWRGERARALVVAGFMLAGAAGVLAVAAKTPLGFRLVAAFAGLGLGIATVGLAATIRGEVGGHVLGRCIGIGTGLAYAVCNLPVIFKADPATQAIVGVGAALAGMVAVACFSPLPGVPSEMETTGREYAPKGIAAWVTVLFALVATDSAMFYQIQDTPELRAGSWATTGQLGWNALAHLLAGVVAGVAYDRGRFAETMAVATALLGTAGALIFAEQGAFGAPLYAAAVSAYSAGLVFYPARTGRPGLAALVYAVAGWLGSALGIALGAGF